MTPWVRRLLIANVVMFVLTGVNPVLFNALVFVPRLVLFRPWSPVTYMFLHAGLWHLFFNMLGLYFFGPRLEARLGSKNFLWLYMLSGLGGAALSFVFAPMAGVVGASGAVFGVFIGFARFWPTAQIYIWGVFPIQARWLVAGLTALALFGGLGAGQDGIAHFAHLGGFLAGFLWLRWLELRSPSRQFKKKMYANVRAKPGGDASNVARWRHIRRDQMHEVNRSELDRLLAKIEEAGVASLTLDERAFLDRFT